MLGPNMLGALRLGHDHARKMHAVVVELSCTAVLAAYRSDLLEERTAKVGLKTFEYHAFSKSAHVKDG